MQVSVNIPISDLAAAIRQLSLAEKAELKREIEANADDALRTFGTAHAALDFWKDEQEDVYQDYLPKQEP